jgi:hypothetical protein
VQQAYEVLSDVRKRTVYDQYGMMGVDMFERYGSDSPLAAVVFNARFLATFFCCASLLLSLVLIFMGFLSARVDGSVAWSWGVVFIPLWVLDALLLVPVVGMAVAGWRSADAQGGSAHEEDGDSESNPSDSPAGGDGKRSGRPRTVRSRDDARALAVFRYGRLRLVAVYLCVVVWQILLAVQLDTGHPGWLLVWVPLFVVEGLNLIENVLVAWLLVTVGRTGPGAGGSSAHDDADGAAGPPLRTRLWLALDEFRWWAVRTTLVIFVALRTANVTGWNWALVALPFFVGVALAVVIIIVNDCAAMRRAPTAAEGAQACTSLTGTVLALMVALLLVMSFVGMVVVRLNQTSPPPPAPTEDPTRSVAVILTPVWLVVSFLWCCCCCCLPCLVAVRGPGETLGENVDDVARAFNHRPRLYIEASRNGPQAPWTVNMV